jgi:hypothetical protein
MQNAQLAPPQRVGSAKSRFLSARCAAQVALRFNQATAVPTLTLKEPINGQLRSRRRRGAHWTFHRRRVCGRRHAAYRGRAAIGWRGVRVRAGRRPDHGRSRRRKRVAGVPHQRMGAHGATRARSNPAPFRRSGRSRSDQRARSAMPAAGMSLSLPKESAFTRNSQTRWAARWPRRTTITWE